MSKESCIFVSCRSSGTFQASISSDHLGQKTYWFGFQRVAEASAATKAILVCIVLTKNTRFSHLTLVTFLSVPFSYCFILVFSQFNNC